MSVVHRRPQGPDSDAPPGTAQPISRAPEAAPTVRVQYPPQPIETGRGASPLLGCLRRLLRSRLPRRKALPVGAPRPSQLPDAERHQCEWRLQQSLRRVFRKEVRRASSPELAQLYERAEGALAVPNFAGSRSRANDRGAVRSATAAIALTCVHPTRSAPPRSSRHLPLAVIASGDGSSRSGLAGERTGRRLWCVSRLGRCDGEGPASRCSRCSSRPACQAESKPRT